MTDVRDVGDGYNIRYEARDPDTGALTDASVALVITAPTGTTTPSPTHTGTGLYDYTIPLTTSGPYFWAWEVTGAITDRTYGHVLAADPAPAAYATLAEMKDFLKIAHTDTSDDAELGRALLAGMRRVHADCGRTFATSSSTVVRTYRATHPCLLLVDDIARTDDLVVEVGRGSSWTAVSLDDIDFLPENAETDLRAIEILERVNGVWPIYGATRVRITAYPGWPAVPEDIVTANIIAGARLFRRKDSPEGVLGNSEFGPIRVSKYDADYDNLIGPYVRPRP